MSECVWDRGSEEKDRLYSHLLINGGHHHHLTQLIDPYSLQGLCCVSISYWLFQVHSYWPLSLPPYHCSRLSAPPGNYFKQSFEIIICESKCHNRPQGLVQIGKRAEVSEVNDTSQYWSICVMTIVMVTGTKMADLSSLPSSWLDVDATHQDWKWNKFFGCCCLNKDRLRCMCLCVCLCLPVYVCVGGYKWMKSDALAECSSMLHRLDH